MIAPTTNTMSIRGWSNVSSIMPKISGQVAERSRRSNPNIDLSTAENWLIRREVVDICKEAIKSGLDSKHLSYPSGFSGDPDLLNAFAAFFNKYFNPRIHIDPGHLVTAPGASTCIDALLYNICDPGDGILIPGPYWSGFDFGLQARCSVVPILVTLDTFESSFTPDLILALETTYERSSCSIKGLIITNPHNPLGRCYTKSMLEQCVKFCQRRNLHFISDEVYALSSYESHDLPEAQSFVSALSLDLNSIDCDLYRVHTIWSTSKDLGQSGFRMGCTITQGNMELAVGLALASNTQTSSLTAVAVQDLLTSPKLPDLLSLNYQRLSVAYWIISSFFKRHSIPYFPCNAGIFIFANLAPDIRRWEDEAIMVGRLKEAGVLVSSGRGYHGPVDKKGWMRVGFAVETELLVEALKRMECVLGKANDFMSNGEHGVTPQIQNGTTIKSSCT